MASSHILKQLLAGLLPCYMKHMEEILLKYFSKITLVLVLFVFSESGSSSTVIEHFGGLERCVESLLLKLM